ncbi:19482_t:CDS:1, partial [Gigaspora rosea]
ETSSNVTTISYTESTTGTSFPRSAPQVVNVQTYDDGVILVSVARQSDQQIQNNKPQKTQTYNLSLCTQNLENLLLLRIIQLDGSIEEINSYLNLDP